MYNHWYKRWLEKLIQKEVDTEWKYFHWHRQKMFCLPFD